ncbi:hypothetical protein FHR83_006979 [Actinoplanes campanulatus]|uniref:PEGA domain-containing protein n=1 Tax=Actinoplanes campanulatus TaxID=113559 RepID=A0A7W5AMZ4_9ACTN|nr:hypothetical protein [Actinoplanes campanulatus]MBB3099273.1 hypothetical protein [Actinoplanes campanulatus]GGN40686.1 hypothetical protein GCM10010109_70120 [Actinoplanes campanulatus]GID40591.1 hypothetical protein Aca09nite_70970 [Actinoplanes campanulatus]
MNPSIIDLRYPSSSFLYSATSPKIFVDGVEQAGTGWGKRPVGMAPGPHRIEVYVPYVLPLRAGRATLDLTVPETGVGLEYMAPTITFAKGQLGAPGQQKSSGFRGVMALNVIVITVVAIALIAALLS